MGDFMYKSVILPYNYGDLEPVLNSETINVHYNKHYLGYLEKLNKILNDINYDYRYTKEELVSHIEEIPIDVRDDVLYNLGGVLNHELYFYSMSNNKVNVPIGALRKKIIDEYGTIENFKDQFIKTANKLVGSGYTFLVLNNNLKLDNMYIDKLNNDISSAYDVLSNSMKEKYVSLDNFRLYINNNLNRITTDADKCSLEKVKNKRIYTVLDKNSNKYVFVETNIMNYKVDFYLYDNSGENK